MMPDMTKVQVKEIFDRVLTWPADDQERLARFVDELEQRRAEDDLTDEDWKIIDERIKRRNLASDVEVQALFDHYRHV